MDVQGNTASALQWPDYVVVGAVLMVSASIGVYYRFSGGRQKTTAEYFSGNNSMSIPMLAIAMMVAALSAIALLGISGETYIYGAQFNVVLVGWLIGTPISAFLYLPVFFKLRTMSVYEYLELRFGVTARLAASISNYIEMNLYTGVVLYAPALALEATTGLSSTMSILLIGLICTFYSSLGGIKAVLATDVFQGILMFATIFCIIAIGCYDIDGGISEVWRRAGDSGRLNFFDFNPDPTERHTWWSLTAGGTGIFVLTFAVNQIHVQRLLSAKSLKSAQVALFLNTPLAMLLVVATSFSGLVLYAWFEGCDPVASGQISSFDQVMPHFARLRLSKIPGLTGFFIAGIFCASLSTVSAMLNSLAAIAIADYVKPIYRLFGRDFSPSMAPFYGKLLSVVNGLLCVGIAFLAARIENLMQTGLVIYGAIGGPALGLFSLGMFVESANETGSVIGTVVSLLFCGWVGFGFPKPPEIRLPVFTEKCTNSNFTDSIESYSRTADSRIAADPSDYFYLYRISYMWYTPLGFATAMIFGYLASIVVNYFARTPITLPDPDLFTPMVAARIRRRRRENDKTTKTDPVVELKITDFVKLQ